VVLDYECEGKSGWIDIDNASKKVQLKELILSRLPGKVQTVPVLERGVCVRK